MPADIEKSVRKWITQLDLGLAAASPDIPACQAAFSTLRGHVEQLLSEYFTPITLSERLWSDALLAQARDDLRAAEVVAGAKGPPSALAMLLQMVFEKLAKAALARTDKPCFIANRTSHAAASRLISTIKNHNEYLKLRYEWKDVLSMVQSLERAHPALAKGGPHLEYPWEAGTEMGLPATHLTIVKQLSDPLDPKGPKLLRFARELSNRFDELFP
ncbi:hypothetical protein [Sorangium sp. So ce854]|uniref:hypothetical protein n=1 Tax=Sorangium sp. So ce854 TaxID=3133322 RepID=UPI003F62E501